MPVVILFDPWTGWMRFGAGWVEFQLDRSEAERATILDLFASVQPGLLPGASQFADLNGEIVEDDPATSEHIAAPAAIRDPFSAQHHPMWDRWLDA